MSSTAVYTTEEQAAAALDAAVTATGLFTIHKEVRGTLTQPRPGQVDKGVRIDRILIPNQALIDLGWRHGIVGVEIKRSGVKLGPALAQAMDYTRCTFTLDGGDFLVVPTWVLVWPAETEHGPLASLMAQSRVGIADANQWATLRFRIGEVTLLHISSTGEVRIGSQSTGRKVGSR